MDKLKLSIGDIVKKQIEQIEYNKKNGIISESDKMYFDLVHPTYIENWNKELYQHSIQTEFIKLTLDDVDNLLKVDDGKYPELRNNEIPDDFKHLFEQLDEKLKLFPNGAFVRLGSRSPKDVYMYRDKKGIHDAFEAIHVLLSSMRIFEDLHLANRVKYEPYIVIREWIDIEPWREFRCFSKQGELKAISQYFYNDEFDQIKNIIPNIEKAIKDKYMEIKDLLPECVVFDIIYSEDNTFVLEINPYNKEGRQFADPCLFNWDEIHNQEYDFRYIDNQNKDVEDNNDFVEFLNNLSK